MHHRIIQAATCRTQPQVSFEIEFNSEPTLVRHSKNANVCITEIPPFLGYTVINLTYLN